MKNGGTEKELIKNKLFWCLNEIHPKDCDCSYCGNRNRKPTIHYGLNIPKNWKKPNAWYVFKYGKGKYIRWTNSWIYLLKFKTK
jgi:hypothetical protein